jgi:hypothetical protein
MFSQLCSPWQLSRRRSPAPVKCTTTTTTITIITVNEIGPLTGAFFFSGQTTPLFFEPLFGPCYKSKPECRRQSAVFDQ